MFRETVVRFVVVVSDRKKRKQAKLLEYVDEIGAHSLLLVLTVSTLFGIALTVPSAFQLKEVGGYNYIFQDL